MTLSEYIHTLQVLLEEHGDLPVETCSLNGRVTAPHPTKGHRLEFNGHQKQPRFFIPIIDAPIHCGKPVIRV